MNISFIGLGKLGLPCAEEISKKGHSVKGYDAELRTSDLINITNSITDCVSEAEIVFIAVPTPHDSKYDGSRPASHLPVKDFNYDIVKHCLIEANKCMNKTQLLVLISTVLPGTTRKEFVNLVTNTRFVYNPYLIAMGSVAWDMVNPEMVMIGTEDGSETGDASQLINFYKTIMENDPRYVVGTWDECECIKVFYNTFISAKIGLVNMIQDVAMKNSNIDVDVVTDALAKSTMRITGPRYLTAGMGDAGPCHPRDNIALSFLAKELDLDYDLFHSISKAREIQAKNLAKFLWNLSKVNDLPVYIHGKSYKPKVSYTDGSYSLLIGFYLAQMGITPVYVDPLTGDNVDSPVTGVILLAHNHYVTYGDSTSNHLLYCEITNNSIVVDPWRMYNNPNLKVIHYGNSRKT